LLGVLFAKYDLRQSASSRTLRGEREHAAGEVAAGDLPGRSRGACRGQRRFAESGGDIEHAVTGSDAGEAHEPVVQRLRPALDRVKPLVPRSGDPIPPGTLLGCIRIRIEVGHRGDTSIDDLW